MTRADHPALSGSAPRRRGPVVGRLLLGTVLFLAAGSAAALVFTDDARWLRLGIVVALWAALVGAFAAARYRREVLADHDRSEDLRRVYQLELEREVAARREHELEVEADARRRAEEDVRDEMDDVRAELRALRHNLESLLGGEVFAERVALRAEATRLRSLTDQSRARSALPAGSSHLAGQRQSSLPDTGQWPRDPARTRQPSSPEPAAASPGQPSSTGQWPRDPAAAQRRMDQPATGQQARAAAPDPTTVLPRYPGPTGRPDQSAPQPLGPMNRPGRPAGSAARPTPSNGRSAPPADRPTQSNGRSAPPAGSAGRSGSPAGSPDRPGPPAPQPTGSHDHRMPPAPAAGTTRGRLAEPEPGHTGRRRADDSASGGHSRAEEPRATSGRRHRAEEDTGLPPGRALDELLASLNNEGRRHRRDRS